MKVLISIVPYTEEVGAEAYSVYGDRILEYDKPVRCPGNAVLATKLKKGEELKVIYVMTSPTMITDTGEYLYNTEDDSHENYVNINKSEFFKELEDINRGIGAVISKDTVDTIPVIYNDFNEPIYNESDIPSDKTPREPEESFRCTPLRLRYDKLIIDLFDKIPENAELYVDITYGSKTEILSLFCALRFADEFCNADVQKIFHSQPDELHKVDTRRTRDSLHDEPYDQEAYFQRILDRTNSPDSQPDEINPSKNKLKFRITDVTSTYYLFKIINTIEAPDKETASKIFKRVFKL